MARGPEDAKTKQVRIALAMSRLRSEIEKPSSLDHGLSAKEVELLFSIRELRRAIVHAASMDLREALRRKILGVSGRSVLQSFVKIEVRERVRLLETCKGALEVYRTLNPEAQFDLVKTDPTSNAGPWDDNIGGGVAAFETRWGG